MTETEQVSHYYQYKGSCPICSRENVWSFKYNSGNPAWIALDDCSCEPITKREYP